MGVHPAEVPPAAGHPGGQRDVRRGLQPAGGRLAGGPPQRRPTTRWRPHHPRHPLPPLPRLLLLQRHRLRRLTRGHHAHPHPRRSARQGEGEGEEGRRSGHQAAAGLHGAGPAQPRGCLRRRNLPG
ncbi:hypothetical protein VPH35_118897 [Triticum aestivum]